MGEPTVLAASVPLEVTYHLRPGHWRAYRRWAAGAWWRRCSRMAIWFAVFGALGLAPSLWRGLPTSSGWPVWALASAGAVALVVGGTRLQFEFWLLRPPGGRAHWWRDPHWARLEPTGLRHCQLSGEALMAWRDIDTFELSRRLVVVGSRAAGRVVPIPLDAFPNSAEAEAWLAHGRVLKAASAAP